MSPPKRLFVALALLLAPVAALAPAEAAARPTPKPAPVILSRSSTPAPNGLPGRNAAWTTTLVIRKDGAVERGGEVVQYLPADEVALLQRAIKRARFRLDHGVYPTCEALPIRRDKVSTSRGAVSWAAPCGKRPDPTVLELLALVDDLTRPAPHPKPEPEPAPEPLPPQAPPQGELAALVVSLRYDRYTSARGSEAISIHRDGQWTRVTALTGEVAQGRLSLPELEALERRVAGLSFGPPERVQQCAARLDGQATLSLPGRDPVRWSLPCGQLNASLSGLVSEIGRLTRR